MKYLDIKIKLFMINNTQNKKIIAILSKSLKKLSIFKSKKYTNYKPIFSTKHKKRHY